MVHIRTMPPIKVAHLSSHHTAIDNRIFYRECRTLAAAGYDVAFVVGATEDTVRDGVRILAVKPAANRLERVTLTAWRVIRRALAFDAKVYHFHDPELIPWGFLLRIMGKAVVYDVHEDFAQAAGVRSWIPRPLRPVVAGLYKIVAKLAGRAFAVVIAERYYARSFPDATMVLNYPHAERSQALRAVPRDAAPMERVKLVYVGNVTPSRGALIQADIANRIPGCLIQFTGLMSEAVADQIRAASGDATIGLMGPDGTIAWERRSTRPEHQVSTIILEGVGYYVSDRMVGVLSESWTAALAVFPRSEHYYEKELTKFFEYMAAGLPILSSDFPTWRALIEPDACGLVVDPADSDAIVAAVMRLHEDRQLAVDMGERGRKVSQERYSWQAQARNLLALYGRIAPLASETA